MKEYREESLESQITSMLKQVMDEGRNENEERERGDAQPRYAHGRRPFLFVPGFPDSESHFFL